MIKHKYSKEDASKGGQKGGGSKKIIPSTGRDGQAERDDAAVKLSKVHEKREDAKNGE